MVSQPRKHAPQLATASDTPLYRLAASLVYDALDHQHFYRLAVEDSERSMHALLPAIPHLTRLRELDLSQLSTYEPRGEQVADPATLSATPVSAFLLYIKIAETGVAPRISRGHS